MSGLLQHLRAQPGPTFEVVSIRPNTSIGLDTRVAALPSGRFIMTNMPLSAILFTAYELQDAFQVEGLPEWTQKERFDIEAQAPAGVPIAFPGQGTALPRMLQAMLADRMKLTTHVVPMFALVLARADGRLGPNLSRSSIGSGNQNLHRGLLPLNSPCPHLILNWCRLRPPYKSNSG